MNQAGAWTDLRAARRAAAGGVVITQVVRAALERPTAGSGGRGPRAGRLARIRSRRDHRDHAPEKTPAGSGNNVFLRPHIRARDTLPSLEALPVCPSGPFGILNRWWAIQYAT